MSPREAVAEVVADPDAVGGRRPEVVQRRPQAPEGVVTMKQLAALASLSEIGPAGH